jgi:phenylalanyl-tRNA synthetase beta chain
MKVPLSWLKDFLPLNKTAQEIAETFTSLGIEVEKITGMTTTFTGVVVGKVLKAEPHPNADRLKIALVTDGTQEYQVVCGAANCRPGINVAFARIGAELTDGEGKKWKVKKSKIRDVESYGMLCSPKELHLSEEADGILELAEDLVLGIDFSSLVTDPVFDISLTPNLGYCLSVLGLSRELAAAYKMKVQRPAVHLKQTGHQKIDVEVADPKLCPRYSCRVVSKIKVGPSPEWMQKRLSACGLRPINNVVDVANYVMLELGQPLHIFDLKAVVDSKIIVAPAGEPASLETLDGIKREIPPNTILIRDPEKPLAIAGIMGGLSSAATEKTDTILIEAAVFNPASIRQSSRLLDLKTDASYRFERGVDGGHVVQALDRAAQLIQELAGGEIHPLTDVQAHPFTARTIPCRLSRLNQLLGFTLSESEAIGLFERLEMHAKSKGGDILDVAVPTYRNDLQQEVDLIEEIARLYGYQNIPRRRPVYSGSDLPDTPIYLLEKKSRELLLEQGLQECITCDLISPEISHLTLEKGLPEGSTIRVLHPRSVDQSVLRSSLLPGLLKVVQHNFNHQTENLAAFEIGRIHFKENSDYQEASCIGLILTGKNREHHFQRKPHDVDFFDLKGMVENLCDGLRLARYSFEPSHLHTLHPWCQAKIKSGDVTVGVMGQIHPQLLAQFDLHQPIYFAELNLNDVLPLKKKDRLFSELAAFPSSERDWTMTLKENVPMSNVMQAIERTKSPFLENFYLLDLYTSDQLGKDRKNATFRFIYRDSGKTMDFETVEQEHHKLTHSVAEKLRDCLL